MTKMTKRQAIDKLEKAVGKLMDEGGKRVRASLPKMLASAKRLGAHLKDDESPELIDTQAKHLRLQMRAVAEGAVMLDQALQRIKELENDEELFELLADELADGLSTLTKPLESARKALASAKKLLDQAAKAQAQHGSDAKQASEEWAEAVAEVDRLCSASRKEIAVWEQWDKAATEAAARRDAKKLTALQKTKPSSSALDAVAAQPPGMAFKAFDKEFASAALPEDLRKEIKRDREASITTWFNAQTAARRKGEIAVRVAGLKVERRDATKALAALGLPGSVKAKVQAALEGPAAALGKAIEAIAKACKVPLTAADAVAKLKRAGVV